MAHHEAAHPSRAPHLFWLSDELQQQPRPLPVPPEQLLPWACAQANRSVSDCAGCEWWPLPGPLPAVAHPLPPPTAAPDTAWFMCLTEPTGSTSSAHLDFVRAAIVSARLNAPSLAPHVVFLHTPSAPTLAHGSVGARFLAWLRRARVRVLPHSLSFYDVVPTNKQRKPGGGGTGHLNLGAYCRLDVPAIVARLEPELRARGLRHELVLYTDTDVLFTADFELARLHPSVPTFYAGTEVFSGAMNSGVMYLNTSTLGRELPAMLRYAVERRFRFLALDQTWLADWFAPNLPGHKPRRAASPGWQALDDGEYNARAFSHPAPTKDSRRRAGRDVAPPRIWHWHGYKPQDVACWLEAMRRGSWPARGWRDTKVPCRRGRCRWKPVLNSGCRYFGRIDMRPCYLRTYVHLLVQHHRAIAIAEAT